MTAIRWQPTCCAWHGEYAEHPTKAGGVARLKRSPDLQAWQVMVFDSSGQPASRSEDGEPQYIEMQEAEAVALLR